MKIKTTLLTVILSLAAGRAEAQSADGAIDAASDTALADDGRADTALADDGGADTAVPDAALDAALDTKADGVDASASPDAEVDAELDAEIDAKTGGDAAVGDGAVDGSKAPLSDAGSPPDVRLFVHEAPGCSFGGAPGPSGWSLLAAGLVALVGRARRRSNPRR